MEEQEKLGQVTDTSTAEPKKDNVLKKGVTKVGKGISKITKSAFTGAKNFIDEIQAQQEWNKQFKLNSSEYSVLPLNFENDNEFYKHTKYVYAIKLAEKQCLIIRASDKLSVNQVLLGKQNQALQIYDFEDKVEFYPSDDAPYPIKCLKYYYKPYSKPLSQTIQNITNNQNVTVGDNNSGDITLVADFSSQLAEIEKAINDYHPSILNKKKKDEAIKLYGNFKNCVINHKKDEKFFDKFIKVLNIVAPAAATIASTLISRL